MVTRRQFVITLGATAVTVARAARGQQGAETPGATMDGDVHVFGDVRVAWFKDPDGNILNLVNR